MFEVLLWENYFVFNPSDIGKRDVCLLAYSQNSTSSVMLALSSDSSYTLKNGRLLIGI